MTSPAEIPFRSFINLDRHSKTAIYLQISKQLIAAIQTGVLPSNTKLPGTRILGALLDVHRQTVVQAYSELEAQGWIINKPNRGAYVLSFDPHSPYTANESTCQPSAFTYPTNTGFAFPKSNLLDSPFEYASTPYSFDDGIPDIRLTQLHHLSSFYSSNMKRKSTLKKLDRDDLSGRAYFKSQLARYLNYSRGMPISDHNLLITRGTEMSLYIASEILLSPGDTVVVGSLSYFSVNMIFQKSGAKMAHVPVDDEGLDVEHIRRLCERQTIRMVYVNTHRHYPTTVSMSLSRRQALLALSEKYNFIILEDDHDYEFQYDHTPALPLASADSKGMVVYLGTFGRSLAPGFRMGFVVAPENLLREMQKYQQILDRQGDILMEHALGEMIEEGEINRYLKKSLKTYVQRRNHCCQQLLTQLGDVLSFDVPSGGLAIWTNWSKEINLYALARTCQDKGLFIPKTLLYQNNQTTAMRIGFGRMNETEMTQSIQIINESLGR